MVAYTAATLPTVIAANRTLALTKNIVYASASLLVAATPNAFSPSGATTLRYVGQTSLSTDLTNKRYVDAYQARPDVAVTQSWLNSRLDSFVSDILTSSQIDNELNRYVTKQQVRNEQLAYFDKSLLGAPTVGARIGLAKTSSQGLLNKVPANPINPTTSGYHIPEGISTDNVAKFYDGIALSKSMTAGSVNNFTTFQTVYKNNDPLDYLAAQVDIPDPGYLYYPMNFVYVRGKSGVVSANNLRTTGTGNTGLVTVYSPTNSTYYAYGTCTDSPYENWHVALPHGTTASIPSPLRGSIRLRVYLSNYSMSNYTFYASGMTWVIVLMPVLGG
jgi:hypothetical protein